ncbi:MAG: hypothetical protein U0840_08185 [Gemmataceae bacterium]
MSLQQAALARESSPAGERFSCNVPTTCQPPSSWVKDPWPATICDIGHAGLSMVLARRFERGSGLAIELPTEDGSTSTALARVVSVSSNPEGGWMLDCLFISELSDEEIHLVLQLDTNRPGAGAPDDEQVTSSGRSINGVLFQVKGSRCGILRWFVRRLDHGGIWPLERGKVMSLQVGPLVSEAPPLQMKVRSCRLYGSYWVIDARLLAEPSEDVLHFLMTAPTMGGRS